MLPSISDPARFKIPRLLFTSAAVKWERLIVDAPFLATFKVRLDGSSEQPDLVEHVPAYCREVGLDDL